MMTESEAIDLAICGEGILFLGSGFSPGASTKARANGTDMLSASAFANFLGEAAGIGQDAELEDASDEFERIQGSDKLVNVIKEHFVVASVADFQRVILSLPWKRIYTTNYDNVAEVAAAEEGKTLTPCGPRADFNALRGSPTLCIHLNGYAPTLQKSDLRRDFKLTESSYASASITETPAAAYLRQDIRLADVVIFLGYSMFDIDVRRLLTEHPAAVSKTLFYIGHTPRAEDERRVQRYGILVKKTTRDFADAVLARRATSSAPLIPARLHHLDEYIPGGPPPTISDTDILDLLLWGKFQTSQIASSLIKNEYFYEPRKELDKILKAIDEGKRLIAIHSKLGNGKTLLVEGLKVNLKEKGYRILQPTTGDHGTSKEIEFVARSGDKIAMIFDKYVGWLPEIDLFWKNSNPACVIIATERSHVHDLRFEDLERICGEDCATEVPCDRLNDDEIRWIVSMFDQYGLWGPIAGERAHYKVNFLQNAGMSQWHGILLTLLRSPDIAARISKISDGLFDPSREHGPAVAVLVLAVLGERATFDLLVDVFDTNTINKRSVESDPIMSELFDVGSYECRARSAVVAQYILTSTKDATTVVDPLVHMATRFHKLSSARPIYKKLATRLLQFSAIAPVFPEEHFRTAVLSYYERLRAAVDAGSNPLFWLQYAIACIVCNDLDRAKTYFDTAYSIAESKQWGKWDTFQIDNHYVRYLMAKAAEVADVEEFWPMFLEGSRIIDRQMKNEQLHYPYKVARDLPAPVTRFKGQLTEARKRTIVAFARRVLANIDVLPGERRNNKYVFYCKKAMEEVITTLGESASSSI